MFVKIHPLNGQKQTSQQFSQMKHKKTAFLRALYPNVHTFTKIFSHSKTPEHVATCQKSGDF